MTQDELLRKWGFVVVCRPAIGEATWEIRLPQSQALQLIRQWEQLAEAKAMTKQKGK